VLAEVVRSGFTESRHRGTAVVLSADGAEQMSAGRPADPMFPRSTNKPVQAAAMVHCGLALEGKLLALAAASHAGEEFHVAGVAEILAGAGLSEADLQCPPDLPLSAAARNAVLASGGGPRRSYMNCSGKHAGMLAACAVAGWPTASYRDPQHPLQLRIRAELAQLAGEQVTAVGVDGCGAPLFGLSLTGVARAFRALVLAAPGSAERRVADAMRAYPEWMSGTARPDQRLMAAVSGLLVKSGAEGVLAFALADGRAGAVKIDDGAHRAVVPVAAALLRHVTGAAVPGTEVAELDRMASPAVLGGGAVVGQIKVNWPA
jgi:L-asparaginase II